MIYLVIYLNGKLGVQFRHAAKKNFLDKEMHKKRITFCKKYINWTVDDWKKVLFSDESSFLTFRSHPKMMRHLIAPDLMDPKDTLKTMKHPPSFMVWGYFMFFGCGSLYFQEYYNEWYKIFSHDGKKIPITMEIHHTSISMHDGVPCHW